MYTEVQHIFRGFLAHELAHQWWGGAVIPKTYRDAWLSEAMATYAAGPVYRRGDRRRRVPGRC